MEQSSLARKIRKSVVNGNTAEVRQLVEDLTDGLIAIETLTRLVKDVEDIVKQENSDKGSVRTVLAYLETSVKNLKGASIIAQRKLLVDVASKINIAQAGLEQKEVTVVPILQAVLEGNLTELRSLIHKDEDLTPIVENHLTRGFRMHAVTELLNEGIDLDVGLYTTIGYTLDMLDGVNDNRTTRILLNVATMAIRDLKKEVSKARASGESKVQNTSIF